jgi:hypothetical protein
MKVWEAINILESLDPKSEVSITIGKGAKTKEPDVIRDHGTPPYDKTYVIGKEYWPTQLPGYPAWHHTITCTDKVH